MPEHDHHHEHEGHDHHHHEMPTEGRALTNVSISATLHCLTGCAIGEITGVAIGTALGFSNLGTIALAVSLAFLFGYALTSLPLLRAGLALSAVIPIALASDTFSIATMEIVDNAILLIIPGAMEASLSDIMFWGSLSFALAVAFVFAVPVNRWLISKGKGHVAVHETGIHGGPPIPLIGAVTVAMAIFGISVLALNGFSAEEEHGGDEAVASSGESHEGDEEMNGEHGGGHESGADPVRGLSASEGGVTLVVDRPALRAGEEGELAFRVEEDGQAVTDFEVEHERKLHLIVARDDMTGFQHLHPRMDADGTWRTPLTMEEPGTYRIYADFNHHGESLTLAREVTVPGEAEAVPLPQPESSAVTASGYEVRLAEADGGVLGFTVSRDGDPVAVEPYLGAGGHLVALREGDGAYLHTHPAEEDPPPAGEPIVFETELPKNARYRLFLQFKHEGEVHTAEFTRDET